MDKRLQIVLYTDEVGMKIKCTCILNSDVSGSSRYTMQHVWLYGQANMVPPSRSEQ